MSNVQTQRAMASAGICQVAYLVQQVARQGQCDDDGLRQALASILVTDPDRPEAVFGDHPDLKDGYQTLIGQLGSGERKDPELTRYMVSLVALERKLSARKEMLSRNNFV